jgi:hypothetical protein
MIPTLIAEEGEVADSHIGEAKGCYLGPNGSQRKQHRGREANLGRREQLGQHQNSVGETNNQPNIGNQGVADALALNDAQLGGDERV